MDIIKVNKLSKTFGSLKAVNQISFNVREGEIFGLLGPNGAGKTTTIKMLTTLIKSTSGTALLNGSSINKDQNSIRKSIGIIFQDPSLDDELTGRENLEFHAILYNIKKQHMKEKIAEILKLVELEDKADTLVKNYSGGMKRRLEIGRGLVHEPKILFLDEPTVGLDPQTRRHIWEYIKKLNELKRVTVILTTHYIEEADYLCDRVAFVDHGKIVALDTPKALKAKMGGDIISLGVNMNGSLLESKFKHIKGVKKIVIHDNYVDITIENGEQRIPEVVSIAESNKIIINSVNLHKPSLEDVFIYYTGNKIREEEGSWKNNIRAVMAKRGR